MALKDYLFWRKGKLLHDENLCTYCGLCYRRCPHKVLVVDTEQKTWRMRLPCMRCMRCINECPNHALSLEEKDVDKN